MHIFINLHNYSKFMSDKQHRKAAIAEIIRNQRIHTQDELISVLKSKGYSVTQATLSRDVKELGAVKRPDSVEGTYYVLPRHGNTTNHIGIESIEISGQLCVIRSQPGYASAAAAVIDRANMQNVMGTIAGDDTVLVMLKETADKDVIRKSLLSIFQKSYL